MEKKSPILYKKENECCGCTACATICPKQAIKFVYNSEGFLYPSIDFDKCIGCLKCEEICAFKKDIATPIAKNQNTEIFAARSKSEDVVISSSSGGMFTVLSDFFLDRVNGVAACKYVYESDKVSLTLISDKTERNEARGSKYIQAELEDAFSEVIAFLREYPEKKILVVGTGCQIAGLDLVLKSKKMRERAVLVDLICHGAASSNLWKQYIQKVEGEQENEIDYITFKNKRYGWEKPSTFVKISGREIPIKPYSDWFYMGWSLRESCYQCPYTRIDRNSDLTIGDYWGIQKVMPDFYDRMGVSLVITHTDAGRKLFESVKNNIDYRISNRKDCLQPRLTFPQSRPADRDIFWKDMLQKGMDYCIEKYVEQYDISNKEKVKRFIKNVIKKMI